jgi:hypothetical protein
MVTSATASVMGWATRVAVTTVVGKVGTAEAVVWA